MNNFLYLGLFILALLSSCNREHGSLDGEKMPAQNNVELEKKEFVAWCGYFTQHDPSVSLQIDPL